MHVIHGSHALIYLRVGSRRAVPLLLPALLQGQAWIWQLKLVRSKADNTVAAKRRCTTERTQLATMRTECVPNASRQGSSWSFR